MMQSNTSARAATRHLHHEPGEESPSAQTSPGTPLADLDAEVQRMGMKWIAGHYGDGLYSIVLTFNTKKRGWYKGYGTGTTLDEAFQDALEHGKSGT